MPTNSSGGGNGRGWSIALLVASLLLALRIGVTRHGLWVDLDVYIAGGRAVLEGRPLYDVQVAGLPFTYPPFAAVMFVPLTVLPVEATRIILTLASIAGLILVVRVVGHRVGLTALPLVTVVIAAIGSEPVVRNLILGQINIVLMLLVVVDLLVVPARWRGVLIGVATGIKLVPGAFVLLYLLRRDLTAVGRAGAALIATVVVGMVQPAASRSFWSGGLWDLGVGDTIARADNQSLAGIAMRLAERQDLPSSLQALLTAGALGLGLFCASRVHAHPWAGPLQVGIMSVAALLASPVSWTHHWVWIVPVAVVLVAMRAWLLVGAVTVVFWIGVVWFTVPESGPSSTTWPAQVIGALYVVLGLVSMAVMTRHGSRSEQPRQARRAFS